MNTIYLKHKTFLPPLQFLRKPAFTRISVRGKRPNPVYKEKSSKLKLGEILVGRKHISSDILEEVITEQVKDCFFKVLSWEKGTFSFCANESQPEEDILLSERIDHLVFKGIVAMDRNS